MRIYVQANIPIGKSDKFSVLDRETIQVCDNFSIRNCPRGGIVAKHLPVSRWFCVVPGAAFVGDQDIVLVQKQEVWGFHIG